MAKLEKRNSKLDGQGSESPAVRDFTDLDVWKLARTFRNKGYSFLPKLPVEERCALTQQLRRALISITANIAEGFGRYSYRENMQFCRQARGSAYEARDHLITARDAAYISPEEYEAADVLAQRVIQVLNGYIRATHRRQIASRMLAG